MTTTRTVIAGNVTDRWTKKGKEQEMEALSQLLTAQASSGWHLHSLQPVPVYGGMSQKQTGVVLLAVYEAYFSRRVEEHASTGWIRRRRRREDSRGSGRLP